MIGCGRLLPLFCASQSKHIQTCAQILPEMHTMSMVLTNGKQVHICCTFSVAKNCRVQNSDTKPPSGGRMGEPAMAKIDACSGSEPNVKIFLQISETHMSAKLFAKKTNQHVEFTMFGTSSARPKHVFGRYQPKH